MKLILASFGALAAATPSCNVGDNNRFRWYTCKYNPEKWYGVSKNVANFDQATSDCAAASLQQATNPGHLFEAFEASDDLCLFNALKLDSHGQEKEVLIAGKATAQNCWYTDPVTGKEKDCSSQAEITSKDSIFWDWCPNDQNIELDACPGQHHMTYHNQNPNGGYDYGITFDQVRDAPKALKAKIWHNAQSFDNDYGWTQIGAGQAASQQHYYACTIDCSKDSK